MSNIIMNFLITETKILIIFFAEIDFLWVYLIFFLFHFFLFNIAHIFDHFYFIHLMSSPYTFHIFFISSDFWMISIFENMMIYVIAFFISNVGSSLTYVRNCFLEFAWEANLQIKYQDL